MTGYLIAAAIGSVFLASALAATWVRERRQRQRNAQPRIGTGPDTQPGPIDDTYRQLEHLYRQPTARRRTS